MGKQQREKGARGERDVVNMFKKYGWAEASRELDQYQKKLGRDLKGTAPWCVQVKNSETANPYKAWLEAEAECNTLYPFPAAFVKRQGKWFVMMEADLFFFLSVEHKETQHELSESS